MTEKSNIIFQSSLCHLIGGVYITVIGCDIFMTKKLWAFLTGLLLVQLLWYLAHTSGHLLGIC